MFQVESTFVSRELSLQLVCQMTATFDESSILPFIDARSIHARYLVQK
jgi:hypothetical protein